MLVPKFDDRDYSDFMDEVKTLAASYTPEWNFDPESDDFGVVFAKIFAKMMEDTTMRFNRSAQNYYTMFLNILGLKVRPARPAGGSITATSTSKSNAGHIPKGTKVFASAETDDGTVVFETTDDLTAIETSINNIIFTNESLDAINKVFELDAEDKGDSGFKKFRIFDNVTYDNLQTHELYFSDDILFNMKDFYLEMEFFNKFSSKMQSKLPEIFSDIKNVTWQYFKNAKWHDISDVTKTKNGVNLRFNDEQTPCRIDNSEGSTEIEKLYIRAKFDAQPNDFSITSVKFNTKSKTVPPDQLLSNQEVLDNKNIYPFGERYEISNSFYIAANEAFIKHDSIITVNIDLQFLKIKTEHENPFPRRKYRSIMTEQDFSDIKPGTISIETVIWEYWNGQAWDRLETFDPDDRFFFRVDKSNQAMKTLKFKCPKNIDKISISVGENYYIRARINKINNNDDFYADYITPILKSVDVSYDYSETDIFCDEIVTKSNLITKRVQLNGNNVEALFENSLYKYPAMYFSFENPLRAGTIRMFFEVEDGIFEEGHSLVWEYLAAETPEKNSWKHLDILDMTENFIHSGTVTLLGKDDFAEAEIFGKKGYWIRITNPDKSYSNTKNVLKHPKILGMRMNVVDIIQKNRREPEFFSISPNQENKRCKLSFSGVLDVDVWVDEAGKITQNEQKKFLSEQPDSTEAIYDDFGNLVRFWVKWNKTNSLLNAGMYDRVYEIDYLNGEILFGDGRNGRIPDSQLNESIRVKYSTCDGSIGNLDPEKIENFVTNVTDVENVTNPSIIYGGLDTENLEQAADRLFSKICGMNRIVTLNDFENRILAHNRNICKIKCVADVDRVDNHAPGRISIAILPYNFMIGYEKFSFIANDVKKFISENASVNIASDLNNVDIFEVFYVETSVSMDVVVNDFNNYQEVHSGIRAKLKEFLNPVTGNFSRNGYQIGKFPDKKLIYNYIKNVKNIKWIKNMNIFTSLTTDEGKKEISSELLQTRSFIVPIFSEPNINILIS